jgi:hypothetical protein
MTERSSRAGVVAALLVLVGLAWMLWEMSHPASGATVLRQGSPDSELIFTPGRSIVAYNVFVLLVALIPPVYFGLALLERRPYLPLSRARRTAYGTFFGLGLCAAAALGGFAFDLLRSEIRVTHDKIEYRSGADHASIAITDIKRMVLRSKDRNQRLDLAGKTKLVRIDLSPFAVMDQVALVRRLPAIAHLSAMGPWKEGELVWVRIGGQAAPE